MSSLHLYSLQIVTHLPYHKAQKSGLKFVTPSTIIRFAYYTFFMINIQIQERIVGKSKLVLLLSVVEIVFSIYFFTFNGFEFLRKFWYYLTHSYSVWAFFILLPILLFILPPIAILTRSRKVYLTTAVISGIVFVIYSLGLYLLTS